MDGSMGDFNYLITLLRGEFHRRLNDAKLLSVGMKTTRFNLSSAVDFSWEAILLLMRNLHEDLSI